MYSSANNHDKSHAILSLQELLGIIVVFSFVLYLLFPKGNIEDFLESQGKHTNLSINYLQSMILYHPDNIDLKMMLTQKYARIGEEQKALQLNDTLIQKNSEKKLLIELYKTDYLLNKTLYFKKKNPSALKLLKKRLLNYYEYSQGERNYLFFFAESTNIDYGYLKYHSLKHYMEENPSILSYELEKIAFDLANKLGYKDEAHVYLENLTYYPETSDELTEYFVYSLFEQGEFTKAKEVTTKLFLTSQAEDDLTKYFHLALYALVQDENKSTIEVSQLIQNYANLKELYSPDIVIILNTLLELGDSKEAANFSINMLYTNPESFNETGVDLALQSLLYHAELEQARALSFFAESKFQKQKYLDKTILITSWLGEQEAVLALNKEGYYKYKSNVYEKYFLKNQDFYNNHEILGKIYKKKIQNGQSSYFDKIAEYYDYTGKINEAEAYFTQISKKQKKKKAAYYAIDFSYKNSHFKKGLVLYQAYQSQHGIEPKLHELSIKRLLAMKQFDKAYAFIKVLKEDALLKKRQRFITLAWLEKDYDYLHENFTHLEKENKLTSHNFEQFILLEKALNQATNINYIYKRAWEQTHKPYHLSALMEKLLQDKKLKEFNTILNTLNKNDKKIINDNIYFQMLLAEYHIENSNIELALHQYDKIFKLEPNKITSHQSYLWFLLDNQESYPKLKKRIPKQLAYLQKHPTLRKKVGLSSIVAAMHNKSYRLAKHWLKQALQKNPNHKEYKELAQDIKNIEQEKLYTHYDKMLNEEYLNTTLQVKRKYLGSQGIVNETSFSYQWNVYKNLKSKIMLKHYKYKTAKGNIEKQTAFELALKNSKKNFLWDLHLAQLKAKRNYLSASLDLHYKVKNFQIDLGSKYQNKTTLTPQLEMHALENSLKLKIQTNINTRTSFSFLIEESNFKTISGLNLGSLKQINLSSNYILRTGYPNISFGSYLSHNQLSKNIAQDFSEFGLTSSIGTIRQHTINTSWKPFASTSIAINNQKNIGASLILGVSKSLKSNDSLDLHFNYYNSIGVINEPIYGINLQYRF